MVHNLKIKFAKEQVHDQILEFKDSNSPALGMFRMVLTPNQYVSNQILDHFSEDL